MSEMPKIGLVCSQQKPKTITETKVNQVNDRYTRAILAAGGLPLLIPLEFPISALDMLLDEFDGILVIGGDDVSIDRFDGVPHSSVSAPTPERDELEIALVRLCMTRNIPLLGICRGHQVMNVAMGGTLITDIGSQVITALPHQSPDETPVDALAHSVSVAAHTRLSEVLRTDLLHVNTFHHQAIKELAPCFRAAAHAPDGIIEAIEAPAHPFAIGVQWHPECLPLIETQQRLFSAFVSASKHEM